MSDLPNWDSPNQRKFTPFSILTHQPSGLPFRRLMVDLPYSSIRPKSLECDLLDEQGRVEAAVECFRTALRVAPDYADAIFNLALLLQRINQYAEAANYWRRYLASDCQSEWAARARRSLEFCEMQINLIASA
jgi:tetratricopeptide (TPR) repeat protein